MAPFLAELRRSRKLLLFNVYAKEGRQGCLYAVLARSQDLRQPNPAPYEGPAAP